jgi:arsenite-transporting ATPase
VTAARLEDDLVVGVGDRSRVVTLPSVLRRCHVRDAVLEDAGTADAVLRVGFEPNPALWRS